MPIPVLRANYQLFIKVIGQWLATIVPFLPWIGLGILLVILLAFVVRILALVISLRRSNVLLKLTPPASTDVSAISTAQLFRLVHGLSDHRSWLDRFLFRNPSYSFEIVSRKETGIQYLLRVPTSHAPTVEKTLRGYLPGLKIEEMAEYLPNKLKGNVIEFGLRKHFGSPLKDQSDLATHDPIAYLTNSMTQLAPNELIALQLVVRPIGGIADSARMREINHLKWKLRNNLLTHPDKELQSSVINKTFMFLMRGIQAIMGTFARVFQDAQGAVAAAQARVSEPKPVAAPISAGDQALTALIGAKLEQPLFVCAVRALLLTDTKQRRSRGQGLIASFASFTSGNDQALRTRWSLLSFVKRWQFRMRLLPNSGLILAPTEIAGLYHFPVTDKSHTEDLVRSRSPELPAPLSFKQAAPHFDNVFATNTYAGKSTSIGLTLEERRRHTYILGSTGSGKTTLLATMIHQDIVNGKGVAVVDPHGQLVEQLLRTIPNERIKDVVWFAPDDDGFPIALNLLDLPINDGTLTSSQIQKQKSFVSSSIISIFQKLYDPKYFGPRMEILLRNAILTVFETSSPTLLTIQDLLTQKDFRKQIVDGLTNDVLKNFWIYEFEKLGSLQRNQWISPVTNKVGGLLSSPINYNILTQPKSKLDFDDVMNNGKILLCDLSKGKIGEDESSFFGSLIIAKLQLAALRRALIPEADRKDFYLYVDEFQNFATDSFGQLVSEARKYRLATILAHQSISQIEDRDIIENILANVGTTITFRTANPEDERFMLPIFSPEVSKHEIANLPLYTFYMKVAVSEPQDAFKAMVNNFTVEGSDEISQAVIDSSRAQFSSPINLYSSTPQPIYPAANLYTEYIGPSGSDIENLFPLSLTGTEYGGDWQISTTQKLKHPNLTSKHYDILMLIYRFRFLNRSQLQQLLKLNTPHNLNAWLKILTDNTYISRNTTIHTSGKQPAIYALNTHGIQALKTAPHIDTVSLRKLYREHERSTSFIQRCLLMADINLGLVDRTATTVQYGMYVPSDYPTLKLSKHLTALAPHAVIVRQRAKETDLSFIEVLSELPDKHLKTQLHRYIEPFDTGEWKHETHVPFPALLLVATTSEVLTTTQRLITHLTRKLEGAKPKILITTSDKVTQHGITGDIFETLS